VENYYVKNRGRWHVPVAPVEDEILNPFKADGVEVSVALASELPYENVKSRTVLGMLRHAKESGMLNGVHTLIENTSGNTGLALALLAGGFGSIKRVDLIVPPDIPSGKEYPLKCAGARLIHPEDELSGIATARKRGGGGWRAKGWCADEGCLNLDQYANPSNAFLHERKTGPEIMAAMGGVISVFGGGIGTGGTVCGVSKHLRSRVPAKIVGVLCSPNQGLPGVRTELQMQEITLPWRESVDVVVEVGRIPSFAMALWFGWLMGLAVGPSSGFAYIGVLKFLQAHKDAGMLDSLRQTEGTHKGKIRVAVLFPDTARPYGDRFSAFLSSHPVNYFNPATAPKPAELLKMAA